MPYLDISNNATAEWPDDGSLPTCHRMMRKYLK